MKEIILSYLSMLFYEIAAFFAFQKLSNKKINMKTQKEPMFTRFLIPGSVGSFAK